MNCYLINEYNAQAQSDTSRAVFSSEEKAITYLVELGAIRFSDWAGWKEPDQDGYYTIKELPFHS